MTTVRYTPGSAPAFVTAGGVLMLAERVSARRIDELYAGVMHAETAREVLVELSGGHLVDLDGLPDFAFVSRRPDALRVTLRGRVRCVVHDGEETVELDGSDVALVGEWRFGPHCRVDLSVGRSTVGGHRPGDHAEDPGEGTDDDFPLVAGVVLAERVRWEPAPDHGPTESPVRATASTAVDQDAPMVPEVPGSRTAPEPVIAVEPQAGPGSPAVPEPSDEPDPMPRPVVDATLMPDLSTPGSPVSIPAGRPPTPRDNTPSTTTAPASAPTSAVDPGTGSTPAAEMPVDESGVLDHVDYTIGGGIDYERLLGGGGDPAGGGRGPEAGVAQSDRSASERSAQDHGEQPVTGDRQYPPAGGTAQPAVVDQPGSAAWTAFAAGDGPDHGTGEADRFGPGTWITPDRAGDTVPPGTFAPIAPGAPGRSRASTTGATGSPTGAADSESGTGGGTTSARLCPQNHANPPHLQTCRICSAPLDGPTVRVARPTLGVVRLSTGVFFDLDRPLVFGREPRIDAFGPDEAPRPIVLPSPDKAISRSHLRIDIDGWSVLAVDLGSKNGTYLRRGAAEEIRLMPDEAKMLMAGDVLVVDDVDIRFEDLP